MIWKRPNLLACLPVLHEAKSPVLHVEGFSTPLGTFVFGRPRTVNISLCLCGRLCLFGRPPVFNIVSLYSHLSCTVHLAFFTLKPLCSLLASLYLKKGSSVQLSSQRMSAFVGQTLNTVPVLDCEVIGCCCFSCPYSDLIVSRWLDYLFCLAFLC